MSGIKVVFYYITGVQREIFTRVLLSGSWDDAGRYSNQWSRCPMEKYIHSDGCPAYRAEVFFDPSQVNWNFRWGVVVTSPEEEHRWGITTETKEEIIKRYRSFTLGSAGQQEEYYLTHCRRLGANKHFLTPGNPGIRFVLWAPNARVVELVFASHGSGYITESGAGAEGEPIPLIPGDEGTWYTDQTSHPPFADFGAFVDKAYMYRITRQDGSITYRTDIYSRRQAGKGTCNPGDAAHPGPPESLEAAVSCSLVVDPDLTPPPRPPASRPETIRDLIIYELQVEALGFGLERPGHLEDAVAMIPHLQELGVNAVELLPLRDTNQSTCRDYAPSHHMAIEERVGSRETLKKFVESCHAHGILVLMDVVFDHLSLRYHRSYWKYDSPLDENNIYYWYEGKSADYPFDEKQQGHPGGYIFNGSCGYAPRYHEEMVRKLFISSAVSLVEEFNIDGLRFQLVSAIHNNNRLNSNKNQHANQVNIFGAKFLREINRTLRLLRKEILLIAEDHSQWDRITSPLDYNRENDDSLGFDAVWSMEFYHNLIGDTTANRFSYARLLFEAGFGESWPLKIDLFAYQGLNLSRYNKIVFHEFHAEDGFEAELTSQRTIEVASHSRLDSHSLATAEARCRFAAGMSLLSAGTPMFFMFEELRARYKYDHPHFLSSRENYQELKEKEGHRLFQFYKSLIRLRKEHSSLRSLNIKILHIHNSNRVLAFRRWDEKESLLIIASLNNEPFDRGYEISHYAINGNYKEIFNSDLAAFGGNFIHNNSSDLDGTSNSLNVNIPANGFVVLCEDG